MIQSADVALSINEASVRRASSLLVPRSNSISEDIDDVSFSDPSTKRKRIKLRKGIVLPAYGEITWAEMWQGFKVWFFDPVNAASLVWCILTIIDMVPYVLLQCGALNGLITDSAAREDALEISSQIMNALFVLMTVVFHPLFIRHSVYLYRQSPKDKTDLRNCYNKGGHEKPNEWIHLLILNILLHISCISMYAYAMVYWIYGVGQRPVAIEYGTLVASIVVPVIAAIYFVMCPLQKDYNEIPLDVGKSEHPTFIERDLVFVENGEVVKQAQWKGSLVWDWLSRKNTACLSLFLPCVVFGRTQHRLGLGQKYVQASVFVFVVLSPLVLFNLAGRFVVGETTRKALSFLGIGLAWTGLIYGALWRTHMRRKFKLPSSRLCFGSGTLTDCFIWLFCPVCAISQESRTARGYTVVELGADGELYVPEDETEPDENDQNPLFEFQSSAPVTVEAPVPIRASHSEKWQ